MKRSTLLIIILPFCLIGKSKGQIFSNLELIEETSKVSIYKSDSIFNYLLDKPQYDIKYLRTLSEDDLKDKGVFIINHFKETNKFYVFNRGELIYSGEGGLDSLNGKHLYSYGSEEIEGTFKNGKLHGEYIIKNKIKNNLIIRSYKNGKLDGNIRRIDKMGVVLYFCQYKDGIPHGLEYYLYDNYTLRLYRHYQNGKLQDGNHYIYDDEGNIIVTKKIKNGKTISVTE